MYSLVVLVILSSAVEVLVAGAIFLFHSLSAWSNFFCLFWLLLLLCLCNTVSGWSFVIAYKVSLACSCTFFFIPVLTEHLSLALQFLTPFSSSIYRDGNLESRHSRPYSFSDIARFWWRSCLKHILRSFLSICAASVVSRVNIKPYVSMLLTLVRYRVRSVLFDKSMSKNGCFLVAKQAAAYFISSSLSMHLENPSVVTVTPRYLARTPRDTTFPACLNSFPGLTRFGLVTTVHF